MSTLYEENVLDWSQDKSDSVYNLYVLVVHSVQNSADTAAI